MSEKNSRAKSNKKGGDTAFSQKSTRNEKRGSEGTGTRKGARFMAILMIALMVIFSFATAGMYLLN
ncbi:hypothetical protein [Mobilibacterium timonense]|uniref:hypothetical protein n=1 Tax=Mobilibacterium timonense TaxID=1871012 RepID=UPI00098421E7|nr:hypothetical protein [Mobilibacterium timonense]MBM6989834.1 hypothetical protein [Mobilibacterium timonense]